MKRIVLFVYWKYFINSLVLFCTVTSAMDLSTLQLVQIITRHGDRSPLKPYPNDLYQNASVFSFNGWGELTEIGEKQLYELGSFLRRRYDGFLPTKYYKRDFYIISSDVDRTIISAESNLAGLFKRDRENISRQDILNEWQPVPIHTIPEEFDNLISGKAKCSRYDSLLNQVYESEEIRNVEAKYKSFLDFLSENSGAEMLKLLDTIRVQDPVVCQRNHNLTLPVWVNDTVYDQLQYFRGLTFTWRVFTDEMKRLKGGPLLGRIVEKMKAKADAAASNLDDQNYSPNNDASAYRKMYIYSSHDHTIAAFLQTLNLFEPHAIPYAAAVLIELHKEPETGYFFIELYYRNDTTIKEPYKLDTTSVCGTPCNFSSFSEFTHKFIPTDWNQECQSQLQPSPSEHVYTSSSILVYTILVIVLIVVIMFMICLFLLIILLRFSSKKIGATNVPISINNPFNSYQTLSEH